MWIRFAWRGGNGVSKIRSVILGEQEREGMEGRESGSKSGSERVREREEGGYRGREGERERGREGERERERERERDTTSRVLLGCIIKDSPIVNSRLVGTKNIVKSICTKGCGVTNSFQSYNKTHIMHLLKFRNYFRSFIN